MIELVSKPLLSLPLARGGSFWFPPQASDYSAGHDFTYDLILWMCLIFFVIVCGATVYFSIKYRKRPGHKEEITSTHNARLELAWSIIPLALLMVIFGVSTYWYFKMLTPPGEDTTEVQVSAKQWSWSFTYKGGALEAGKEYYASELLLIKDEPYQLVMTTPDNDVIHSLFIPAFRVKQDCVPGRYNKVWFRPTKVSPPEGFNLFCTEYCGRDHSNMITRVHVYESEVEWIAAVQEKGDITNIKDLVDRGKRIYDQNCKTCHNITGDPLTGPNFGGLWGKTEELESGRTVVFGEGAEGKEYIRESVFEPGKEIVKGYPNGMTLFNWGNSNEEYLKGIMAYLESLKDEGE